MKLEHFGMAEPGDCRLVFTADAEELERAITAEQAAPDAPQAEEDLLTAAVNRTILEGFSALYEQIAAEYGVTPVTDPDFELLAVNRAEGFRAGAQFYALPPLTLGRYTGFVQAVEPHLIRQLTIEMEINRHHGDEERAADAAGKAALRQQVARELYAQRCVQAKARAEKEVIWQLGDEVTGPLPKQLVGGNYFAEQRQFNLSLQANGINFVSVSQGAGPDGGRVPHLAAHPGGTQAAQLAGAAAGSGSRGPAAHGNRGDGRPDRLE